MTPLNVEAGLSASASSASKAAVQAGTGDTNISLGGGKQTQTLFIVAGLVALAVIAALVIGTGLWLGRRRR